MDATEIRRLTELAARTVGFVIRQDIPTGPGVWGYRADDQHKNLTGWKPAHDDCDALRLAVDLGINLHVDVLEDDQPATSAKIFGRPAVVEKHGDDPYAATRLAVLRAAAALGEQENNDA